MNASILTADTSDRSLLIWLADQALTPFAISQGQRLTSEGKTHQVGVRILAGLVALLLFPATLFGLTVKWLQRGILKKGDQKGESSPPPPSNPFDPALSSEEVASRIKRELEVIQPLDTLLGEPSRGSWRAYGKNNGEANQTYDSFAQFEQQQQPLNVQRIGDFSQADLKIIAITCDFLSIIHGVSIRLQDKTISMDQLKEIYLSHVDNWYSRFADSSEDKERYLDGKRRECKDRFPSTIRRQYDASLALSGLLSLKETFKTNEDSNPQIIAFTNVDLYADDLNFVFGQAYLGQLQGVGIWSNARFGNPTESPKAFERCLLRMMKIANHEFGHMRNLPHCTDYECNIGGYMSLKEVDERPLLLCAQDSAKICYLNRIPLLNYHLTLLNFFENFNSNYKLNIDFSKEIGKLKGRISQLEAQLK